MYPTLNKNSISISTICLNKLKDYLTSNWKFLWFICSDKNLHQNLSIFSDKKTFWKGVWKSFHLISQSCSQDQIQHQVHSDTISLLQYLFYISVIFGIEQVHLMTKILGQVVLTKYTVDEDDDNDDGQVKVE